MDYAFLKALSETPGVSGREERVRELVAGQLSRLKAGVTVDPIGNLIGRMAGNGPRVALMAHMDEVGFLVSKVEPEGYIRVMPMGGIDRRVFWAQQVTVHGRADLPGIVGSVPPHLMRGGTGKEEETAAPIEECFIDLGLPAGEVSRLVRIGDPVTFTGRCWENETAFTGKALDDRVGIFIMLEAAARTEKIDCDLFLIASVQEEYGLRGAGPAVFSVKPDIFLALEGTVASDTPALKLPSNLTPTTAGKGPEIRLTDSRMISDRRLADFLDRIAEEKRIPRQTVVKKLGSTDAAAGQVAGPGVRTCAVSVPVRYIHAPAALLYKSDVENAVSLVAAFLERASGFK